MEVTVVDWRGFAEAHEEKNGEKRKPTIIAIPSNAKCIVRSVQSVVGERVGL